ncbi:HIT family protein [Nonomuraea sp. NPDC048826]|uniref:HIT family protein n=1 Tax=Nonomuraea sp. NPDC048826 TaxID=3364347 RepID=UPI0037105B5F
MDGSCSGADFCQELSGHADTAFKSVYGGDPPERIISRSENLALLVDMSPLCVGHLLLVPNGHYVSFAEVVKEYCAEVEHALDRIFDFYVESIREPVILEHGSSLEMDRGACISHAHLHVLPLEWEAIHKEMSEDGLACTELGGIGALAKFGEGGSPYFYCADRSRSHVYDSRRDLRRQYLRSIAGRLLGIPDPEWDYAVVIRKDILHTTMNLTSGWLIT